jgi:hypothetical protein
LAYDLLQRSGGNHLRRVAHHDLGNFLLRMLIDKEGRMRDATLSITDKFCPDIGAKLDVNKTRQSAPHDSIAWWSIMSTVEVYAEPRNLVQVVG